MNVLPYGVIKNICTGWPKK